MKRGPRSIAADNGHLNICRHDVMQVTGMSLEEQERTNFHKGGLSHYLHRSVSFKLGEFVLYSFSPLCAVLGISRAKAYKSEVLYADVHSRSSHSFWTLGIIYSHTTLSTPTPNCQTASTPQEWGSESTEPPLFHLLNI